MPRLRHFDDEGTARFVTVCCVDRLPLLTSEEIIRVVADEIQSAKARYQFDLLAYVFMPEHFHLVIYPQARFNLGRVIGEIKSRSARRIFALWSTNCVPIPPECRRVKSGEIRHAFWLARCFDHNCRSLATVREKIDYCHKNAVTRGLVETPDQWPFSSFSAIALGKPGLLKVDLVELD